MPQFSPEDAQPNSGMCVTTDHRAPHSKGILDDSLRAREKVGGQGEGEESYFCRQVLEAAELRRQRLLKLSGWYSQWGSSRALGTLQKGDEPFTG